MFRPFDSIYIAVAGIESTRLSRVLWRVQEVGHDSVFEVQVVVLNFFLFNYKIRIQVLQDTGIGFVKFCGLFYED